MSNAPRDNNGRPAIICASSADGKTIVQIKANPIGHGLKVDNNTTGSDNGNNSGIAIEDENQVNVWIALASDGSGTLVEVYGDAATGKVLVNSM